MRKKRARWIHKQVVNGDQNLLLALKNKLGRRMEKMNVHHLYRNAKKLWNEIDRKKNWGIN